MKHPTAYFLYLIFFKACHGGWATQTFMVWLCNSIHSVGFVQVLRHAFCIMRTIQEAGFLLECSLHKDVSTVHVCLKLQYFIY